CPCGSSVPPPEINASPLRCSRARPVAASNPPPVIAGAPQEAFAPRKAGAPPPLTATGPAFWAVTTTATDPPPRSRGWTLTDLRPAPPREPLPVRIEAAETDFLTATTIVPPPVTWGLPGGTPQMDPHSLSPHRRYSSTFVY